MVQNVIETFNVDVIKVTIKDKPGLQSQSSEESLKKGFEALRQYAEQERRIRKLRAEISERNSKRKLRCYFDTWYKRATTTRKLSEYTRTESQMSKETKIELLVSAIAEKQKELQSSCYTTAEEASETQKRPKNSAESAKAPSNSNSNSAGKRPRTTAKVKPASGACAKNRLQAQKAIIEEQRAKLAEQNKYIQDMKFKEIDKETKETSKQTINVVKQALNKCDQQTRRSLIHLMREEGCRDKSLTEIPRIPSPPRFLIRMEDRAEARKQRIKQANEIRQRQREEQKRKEEISRREAEAEQRKQQIQALKKSQKLRKEQEDRRLREIEKNKRLEYLAEQCYRKYLFRRYVLEPLNSLVEEKYKWFKRADQHYGEILLFKIFSAWKNEWLDQQMDKLKLADKLYRHNLLWYAFDDWKSFALDMKQKRQTAVDYYDMKLQGKYMKAWHLLCVTIRLTRHEQEAKAIKHHERHLKIIYFNVWKQYMSVADDINEREQRRDEWRDLIKKFIPDTPKVRKTSLDS